MTEEPKHPQTEPTPPTAKEPHLLDLGNLTELAQWIGPFILGIIGDVIYDMAKDKVRELLDSLKRESGKPRVQELETRVTELIADIKSQSDLADDEIAARVDELFRDFR